MLTDRELWDEGVNSVREGDVVSFEGKPLSLRVIIQRRWGWPKSAADKVARHMKRNGNVNIIWLSHEKREKQQAQMFAEIPDLLTTLCTGLAMGASREVDDASRTVSDVHISFRLELLDEGLTTAILKAVANRLGCSLEELRSATTVRHDGDQLQVIIDAARFNP